MPDPRFFTTKDALSLDSAAQMAGAIDYVPPQSGEVTRVVALSEEDLAGAVIFCSDDAGVSSLKGRAFGLCLTTPALAAGIAGSGAVFSVALPRLAFARLADRLHSSRDDDHEFVSGAAQIDPLAEIHPSVTVGTDAQIGAGARIGAHSHIGCGVIVGDGAVIGPGVSVTHAIIGKNVIILAGAQIGQAGFGFAKGEGGLVRVPQLGRALIGDDVEIGANTTIDRGALLDTEIGAGTKIDNLVQIGHNVRIGRNCVFASQTGISGSCVIGDNVIAGGQVGFADHLTIGDGALLAAQAGIIRDVEAGARFGGTPARPVTAWLRESAVLAKIAKKRIK